MELKAIPKVNIIKEHQAKINNSLRKLMKVDRALGAKSGDAVLVSNEGSVERSRWFLAKLQVCCERNTFMR